MFIGKNDLYAVDFRYNLAPTGNAHEKEVTLQSEYLLRHEEGTYRDANAEIEEVRLKNDARGWYLQATYKFQSQWRAGARISELVPAEVPSELVGSPLDSDGFNPKTSSVMMDWSHSEFSRVRIQYNREDLVKDQQDQQWIIQYIVSLGAHGAHLY